MKCEVNIARIKNSIRYVRAFQRSNGKTFILTTVFNSDVYPISAVKMLKVAAEEITNKVVMFVTNIYYSYTGILLCTYNSNTVCK